MNRIVLIGNGFDLAHNLKTSYKDFLNWYWYTKVYQFRTNSKTNSIEDLLCTIKVVNDSTCFLYAYYHHRFNQTQCDDWKQLFLSDPQNISVVSKSIFFENINKSVETKNWVDIENEYYNLLKEYVLKYHYDTSYIKDLNDQLFYLQEKLIEYLKTINKQDIKKNEEVYKKIYAPIEPKDVSVDGRKKIIELINHLKELDENSLNKIAEDFLSKYKKNTSTRIFDFVCDVNEYKTDFLNKKDYQPQFLLPENIMLLSFNYTNTARLYYNPNFSLNYIHGYLEKPETVIFGYGDELDDDYKNIQKLNENEYLKNVKSIKYMESDNYRNILSFIESAPYQICIMGHSCGNSDRTLLNTLFEHKNCISIKPYYHEKDDGSNNYLELVQNISRNFTDMKLMRDRVVNKTYCEPLVSKKQ